MLTIVNKNLPVIETYSGNVFHYGKFEESIIDIEDIAHSLSMLCRFNGHTREFYSVAQHCVIVSKLCNSDDALWGLLHDATEAYLTDIPSPLKRTEEFKFYSELEDRLMAHIARTFNLKGNIPPSVKNADKTALFMEKRDLMNDSGFYKVVTEGLPKEIIVPLNPSEAEDLFLARYNELEILTV